jgi:MscS family membrane protein
MDAVIPESLTRPILWGVPLGQFVGAVLVTFIGFASRRLIRWVFSALLKRRAAKSRIEWDDDAVDLLPTPLAAIVVILLWHVAVILLELPREPINLRLYVFQGLQAAVAVAATWLVFRLIDVVSRGLERAAAKTETRLDDQLVPLARKTAKVALGITAAVMIVQNLGYSVTSLIASLGIGGLALALAAKDTVSNFFGSVVVFADRPFQVGDWVEFDSIEGTVEEIGFRTTRVRRFDRSLVTVPNQTFSSTAITNHSERPLRRIVMNIGLTYDTSAEQMRGLLAAARELVAGHPGIDQGFHIVHFTEFGESALNLQVYCFTETTVWTEYLVIREELMLKLMDLVAVHGLEMAFPTRTVHVRGEGLPLSAGYADQTAAPGA